MPLGAMPGDVAFVAQGIQAPRPVRVDLLGLHAEVPTTA